MIITKKRIHNCEKYLDHLQAKKYFYIGIKDIPRFNNRLAKIGFSSQLEYGERVLPSGTFGPISQFNAEGRYIKLKDQPKETAYRQIEWHWKEWRGRYDTEEKSKIVDVPYQRYPQKFIPPPSIELQINKDHKSNKVITSDKIQKVQNRYNEITHIISLFLEIFQECEILTINLDSIITSKVRRLNWEVLPPGSYPWDKIEKKISPIIDQLKKGNQPVVKNRLQEIKKYKYDFVAFGKAGFKGYIIFGFTGKNTYVLESLFYGNATYVFEENWEKLSKMTKAEILNQNLQKARIIHQENWANDINKLLK